MIPCALTPHPGIKYLPTTPFEFASPSGKRLDLDISSSRGDPRPLPHTITALAFWNTSFLSASKYTAPVTLPALSTEISRTKEFGRRSHLISHRPCIRTRSNIHSECTPGARDTPATASPPGPEPRDTPASSLRAPSARRKIYSASEAADTASTAETQTDSPRPVPNSRSPTRPLYSRAPTPRTSPA